MMQKEQSVSIRFLANASLLIESRFRKILADGLFDRVPAGFSAIPTEDRNRLLSGKPPFDGITDCLISHYHKDHFDTKTVRSYFETQHPALYLPDAYRKPERLAVDTELHVIPTEGGCITESSLPNGDRIDAFSIPHSGREYREMAVLVYSLVLDGRRILILSDADFDADYLAETAGGPVYDIIFANPLFLDIPGGREALFTRLKAKQIGIYHLPFEGDDRYGLLEMAQKNISEYGPFSCPVRLLRNRGDQIIL